MAFSEYVHKAPRCFWRLYQKLPPSVQKLAKKQFELLKENPSHQSLRFEKLEGYDNYWSARVTRGYRAVASKDAEGFVWLFIGKHDEVYNWLGR
jgi:mRNA-degrading endonuclease RelE of RelBE toxin-antitoxin system